MDDAELVSRLAEAQSGIIMTESHEYIRQGQDYVGVTSALKVLNKPALLQWAANVTLETGDAKAYQRVSREAAGIGTEFHKLSECWAAGLLKQPRLFPETTSDAARTLFEAFTPWATAHVQPLAMEQRVYDDDARYAGTLDLLARIDGVLCVSDYKTSNGTEVYPEWRLQNVAYRRALQKMLGLDETPKGTIVVVPKKGNPEPRLAWIEDDVEEAMSAFLNALELSRWMQKIT